jgi:hypothetical protein
MISFLNVTNAKKFLTALTIIMNTRTKNTQEFFVNVVIFSLIQIFTTFILKNVNLYSITILLEIEHKIV